MLARAVWALALVLAVGTWGLSEYLVRAQWHTHAQATLEQAAHTLSLPMWMKVVWPTGVWTAEAASVLILLRRSLALPIFVVSLAAFLSSVLHTYVLSDGGTIMGPSMAITNAVITALLLFFIWYTRAMTRRGVLT